MSILTVLPAVRPTLRDFTMDEWPQGSAKMRGGRSMRWAQVSAPAGATMNLTWENITYAQAQLLANAWDASYGLYGSLTLNASTIAGLDAGLAALISQPFPDALWRSEGPPVIESIKAGRCTVRLPLRTRYDLAPELAFPVTVTGPAVSCALGTDPPPVAPPGVPQGFAALLQSNPMAVALSWSAVVGATSYRVERSTDNASYSLLSNVSAPSVDFADATVNPATTYWYRVAAVNLAGQSAFAGPVSAITPALWTPASLTTYLWLDADDSGTITQSGGTVSQWNDKSGNSRNFTQGTGSLQPAYTAAGLNSRAVLDFAGDYMTSTAAASVWNLLHNTTGSSVFAVVKAGTSSNPDSALGLLGTNGTASANHGFSIYYDDRSSQPRNNAVFGSITRGVGGAATVSNVSENQWTPNAYQVLGVVSDPGNGTAASRQSARFNGGSSLANNALTNAASSSNASFTLQIGAAGNNVLPLTGGIAEVVIVSGLISAANRERMEGYLAHKWGLTANLPGGHPYKMAAPTV